MNTKPQQVPIESLVPYWRNPRENSAAIQAVQASIAAYGFHVPILVDEQHVIIAGHARYKALLLLGEKMAWVIVSDMPPDKAKEYRVIDNKTSELATWNKELLAGELKALGDGVETLRPFFDPVDIAGLLGEPVVVEPLQSISPVTTATVDGDKLKMPCPHCGEENQIDRKQFV